MPSHCTPKHTLTKCEHCTNGDQCQDGFYCCPFMRLCVEHGSDICEMPNAGCRASETGCQDDADQTTCHCQNPEFPNCESRGFPVS